MTLRALALAALFAFVSVAFAAPNLVKPSFDDSLTFAPAASALAPALPGAPVERRRPGR